MKKILAFIALLGTIAVIAYGQNQKASDQGVATGTVIPAGAIMPFAGSTAPSGWVLAYGQEVSQTGTYAKLYAAISTTYCTTDHGGTCTGGNFRIPDLRGRVLAGKDNMGGSAASRITSGSTIDGTVLGKAGGAQVQASNVTGTAPAHYHGMGTGADLSVSVSGNKNQFDSNQSNPGHHYHGLVGRMAYSYLGVDSAVLSQAGSGGGWASTGAGAGTTGITSTDGGSHTHSWSGTFSASGTPSGSIGLVTGGSNGNSALTLSMTNNAVNNLQPVNIINYIIKL